MRYLLLAAATLASMLSVPMRVSAAVNPDGTWLVNERVAFEVFPCQDALCGRIVWLRNPQLRTHGMCGRTIIWGLTSDGPAQWANGWFFDPENGATYNVSAHVDGEDRISARIYRGFSVFGRTEILTRIESRSLSGWCE
ncbi:MAG: DUF2147 domain-containing protein [Acetobacteraceae bacterium]